jgi:hypothetical protein
MKKEAKIPSQTFRAECQIRLSNGNAFGATQSDLNKSCQIVCFQTKNPNLGKFWRVLQWKMLVYFMAT